MYSMNIKSVRYHLSVLLIVSMFFSLFSAGIAHSAEAVAPGSPAGAAAENAFSDIADSYAVQEIQSLVQAGILAGYEDGTFKPREAMTRAQLAKVLVLALGLEANAAAADAFADVPADSWFKGFVGALLKTNITDGTSQTTFSPDSPVTREQLAVFFIRALDLETLAIKLPLDTSLSDFDQISDWAKPHVSLAFKIGFLQGIDNGDGTLRFSPLDAADRQALARLAYEFKFNKSLYMNKASQLDPVGSLAAAVKAANEAIEALPAVSALTINDKAAVEAARAKVEAARKLGAADKDFPSLTRLADAEKKIAELSKSSGIIGGGGGGSVGGGGGPVVSGPQTLCAISAGTYTGRIKVCPGVKVFGPEQGLAIIQGTLILDPGSAGELELRNIKADNVEILSGAENSIHFSTNVTITNLYISASGQSNQVRVVTSATTVVTRTLVSSQAILESQDGTLGNIDVLAGAANRRVELRGTINGSVNVSAVSSTLVIAQNTTVAQISVATSVSVVSSGTVNQLTVTSAAVNSTVNLSGSFTATTVSVAGAGATLNVGQNTTVSQIQVSAAVTISSNGTVNQIGVTSAVAVSLSGSFTTTTVTVAASGSTLNVGQNTTVSTVVISQTVTSMTLNANGSITTIESTTTIEIVLTGSTIEQVRNSAKQEALHAINALPAVITFNDKPAVEAAHRKVNGAKRVGATFTNDELSKLVNAQNKLLEIKNEAIQDAMNAIAALPAVITLADKPAIQAARAKVEDAVAKGAAYADISNLQVLINAESKVADNEPPVILSGSATIGGAAVPAVVSNNEVTFTLGHSLNNSDMITAFAMVASPDANKLIVTASGLSRTITFTSGTANMTVAQLLGPGFDPQGDGVAVGTIRSHLAGGNLELTGELFDQIGNKSVVKLKIVKEAGAPAPVITSASAVIGNQTIPIVMTVPNYIAFIIDDALPDSAMFTSLTVTASQGANNLTFTDSGQTRTITLVNGMQRTVSVSELLGPALDRQNDGVSVGKLRSLLQNGNITVRGILTDTSGSHSPVTLTIIKGNNDSVPSLIAAAALIDGNTEPAVITSGNTITFTLSGALNDPQMLKGLLIHASSNSDMLTITESGITRTIHFSNGSANSTVSQLLGSAFDPQGNGVSIGNLRSVFGSGSITVTGKLTNYQGVTNDVTVTVIVE